MLKFLICLIFIGNCWSVYGQQFSFDVECVGFDPSETIYLKKYVGFEEVVVDSVQGSGKFSFSVKNRSNNGLYFITVSRNEIAEFILNTGEHNLTLSVNKADLKSGVIGISNSKENEAYGSFVREYIEYEQRMYGNISTNFDIFDPKVVSNAQRQDDYLEKTQLDFNRFLEGVKKQYPNTYTGDVLCHIAQLPTRTAEQKSEYETYHSFLFEQFWSNTDFGKEGLLNHFLFNELLKNYFRHFVPKREDGLKKGVTVAHESTNAFPEINSHVRAFLLRNFLKSNANALSLFVNQLGDEDACSLNLSEEQLSKLSEIECAIDTGELVPHVVLPDRDQQNHSLKDVYSKSKLTIVLFWSANCVHCKNEIPRLNELLKSYSDKRLSLFSINIDENKFDWRDYLDSNEVWGVNVSDVGSNEQSKVLKGFGVGKTPSVFLVNQKGILLKKDLFGNSLYGFVTNYLEDK